MKQETVVYQGGEVTSKGVVFYDPKIQGKRPAVIVAPTWRGLDDFARQKAKELAELGYVGFAADLFGDGLTADTNEKAQALVAPLFINRKELRARIVAAYQTVSELEVVDVYRIGAIGFCFGGLTVIELLRSGVDLRGVVSFHGILGNHLGGLKAHVEPSAFKLNGGILILHGHNDPLVSSEDILNIQKEMTQAQLDWQMHIYGHTTHAFTNPAANDPANNLVFNPKSSERAFRSMRLFFEEFFK